MPTRINLATHDSGAGWRYIFHIHAAPTHARSDETIFDALAATSNHATADQPKLKCARVWVCSLTWASPAVCFGRLEYSGRDSYFDNLCGVLR